MAVTQRRGAGWNLGGSFNLAYQMFLTKKDNKLINKKNKKKKLLNMFLINRSRIP